MKYYGRETVDYPSLAMLETVLAMDFESMTRKKFKAYYTNKKKVVRLLDEWDINEKLGNRFIKAYLEYRTELRFRPANVKAYIIQEDYYDDYDDINIIIKKATDETLIPFKKQGFLYRSVR